MKPKKWFPRSKRLAGVFTGLGVLAVVPIGGLASSGAFEDGFGLESATAATELTAPTEVTDVSIIPAAAEAVDSSDGQHESESSQGSATWTGTDWVIVDQPEGSEEIPNPPAESMPLSPLDRSYLAFEDQQEEIAEIDLVRRLSHHDYSSQSLALRREYNRWESYISAQAQQALEHRLELALQATDYYQEAVHQLETEQKALAQATDPAEQAAAADRVAAAQAEVEARQAAKDAADDLVMRYQGRVIEEQNRILNDEIDAVAAFASARDSASMQGMGVHPLTQPMQIITSENASIRRGPGFGYEKIGDVPAGAELTATAYGEEFYRIVGGGYISVYSVTSGETIEDSSQVWGRELNELLFTGVGTVEGSLTQAPNEPSSRYDFQSYVANVDSQEAVDACTGGLTYSPDISNILGKSYYPIHNFCGGMPILDLVNGNSVNIQSVGVFKVVDSRDVVRGDTTDVLRGIKGKVLLQTCYPNSTKMRVVGLDPV